MPRIPTAEKSRKRRVVAAGVVAGKKTQAIARSLGTTERNVQRIAAEPATQFLITDAFAPMQKKLRAMAARAVQVVEQGFSAVRYVKAGKDDYRLRGDALARLRAVERYGDLMELAQGKLKPVEPPPEVSTMMTWEDFSVMYRERRIDAQATVDQSPTSD